MPDAKTLPITDRLRARAFDYTQTGRGAEGALLDEAAAKLAEWCHLLAAEREMWRELAQRVAHQGNARGLEGLAVRCTISESGAVVSWEVGRGPNVRIEPTSRRLHRSMKMAQSDRPLAVVSTEGLGVQPEGWDETTLEWLLSFVRGEGRFSHMGPGITTHPESVSENQRIIHAALLELERRALVRRMPVHSLAGSSVTWMPNVEAQAGGAVLRDDSPGAQS